MSEQGPGRMLFAFVRYWSRRPPAGSHELAERGRLVLVTEAVAALHRREAPTTVNAVAKEIGIDQSGASRLVSNAVEAGYLSMQASPTDGRRRMLAVTPSGHTLLDQAHDWQEQVFDLLTEGWSRRKRKDFQQAMEDLIHRSYDLEAWSS